MQKTLKTAVEFTGIGLHSGKNVRLVVRPASAEYGVWFRRTDLTEGDTLIPARWNAVSSTQLCTKIENVDGASVSTIEHIMAALAGCGVHNALIDIDGPEVPVMDGSSAQFVQAFMTAGFQELSAPARMIEILEPVTYSEGLASATLEPSEIFEIDFQIEFPDAAIGRQEKSLNMANGSFVRELCDSRTFCRKADIVAMQEQGLALGGDIADMANAVVFDGSQVLTRGGLRHADEPVRHKMLDALGDLALAGAPIQGRYTGVRAGHGITNKLLRKLFATPSAFRMVTCSTEVAGRLPGVGVKQADLADVA
ncbi:UDP-3-O-acyl-N-acetylglucosamine deacetylase [Actibacterium pelagium]|uniref:UDP-3-O-acyl-N-acetylglucosamine deacetylase n=1 Tax=Actibacterium pelagium TaxID=2029103 RepID=A0A917EJ25_9RHOB|nr:UDP-3-O-acyl-N-acetylglucosamine deacetylase [Actibacterium pelagium]GGE47259.1 UDP-3-O-acyl-N-acetylglucosamine deacetylase [Actibacterium pelagium]